MKLTNLKLTNFRTYDDINVNFGEYYNIIYGLNGVGKTNLVEAIYALAFTKSFRCNSDNLMIKKGTKNLLVQGKIKTKVISTYKLNITKDSKIVSKDELSITKLSDYIANMNVILFNPEDVFLIKEKPLERRRLINIEISKISKEYLNLLTSYNKVLKMRNSYLKTLKMSNTKDFDYLDVLTANLANIGQKISNYREEYLININKYLCNVYRDIFGFGNLEVRYVSTFKKRDFQDILRMYKDLYEKEINFGKTLLGIHHDDIVFYLDRNVLKDYGSVGQHKNSILSFKIAEIRLIEERGLPKPILILDDLFSELDDEKIKNIIKLLDDDMQVFITTTDKSKFSLVDAKDYKVFKVEENKVLEEK